MDSRNRNVSSGSRPHQFEQNNRQSGTTESQAYFQASQTQGKQVQQIRPVFPPSFDPTVPPPRLNITSSTRLSSQSTSSSVTALPWFSQAQGIRDKAFVPHGDGGVNSRTTNTYQKDSTKLHSKNNSTFPIQPGRKNIPYQPYQPQNNQAFHSSFQCNTTSLPPPTNPPVFQPGYNQYQVGGNRPVYPSNTPSYSGQNIGSGTMYPAGNIPLFPPASNVPAFMPRNHPPFAYPPPTATATYALSQEDLDRSWVDNWLKQHQIKKDISEPKTRSMKIGEARNLMQQCVVLNGQLKNSRDELITNIELPENEWKECLARTDTIKKELLCAQEKLSDPAIIENLKEKINKRREKRLWFKNRMKRRYLEKNDDVKRREKLHEEIDKWQKEKIEKDLAARKEATLKREAGGVLGVVRRKQTDGRKLLELLKSIKKLREIRKSEGEKKGVYPKTTSENERNFTEKSELIEKLITKRIKSYEDEEKALRVMLMEEEEEREKKEELERLEQKALLNLSKEPDPLADFRRYYEQAEQGVEYLIQIRREWDTYVVPSHVFGASRIPDGEVVPTPPSCDLWSSVLVDSESEVKERLSTG